MSAFETRCSATASTEIARLSLIRPEIRAILREMIENRDRGVEVEAKSDTAESGKRREKLRFGGRAQKFLPRLNFSPTGSLVASLVCFSQTVVSVIRRDTSATRTGYVYPRSYVLRTRAKGSS